MSKYEKLWNFVNTYNEDTFTLTFAEIGEIAGVPLDHAFLRYKKELTQYGWEVRKISVKKQRMTFEKCKTEL